MTTPFDFTPPGPSVTVNYTPPDTLAQAGGRVRRPPARPTTATFTGTAPGTTVVDTTAGARGRPAPSLGSTRAPGADMAARVREPMPPRGTPYSPKPTTPRVGSVVRPTAPGGLAQAGRSAATRAAGAVRGAAGGAIPGARAAASSGLTALKQAGRFAGRVATAPVGQGMLRALPMVGVGSSIYAVGEMTGANEALANTETAQALQRPTTDAIASITGTEDLQSRMMSDDPKVSAAALAEYRAKNPMPEATAPAAAPEPERVQMQGGAVDPGQPESLAPLRRQAGTTLNANRPERIEGSDYSYAGDYGDNAVLRRDVLNADGSTTAEFTDPDTLYGRRRTPPTEAALAAERARVQQAREDYEANTTTSDGRRVFGGAEMAELNQARLETVRGERGPKLNRQRQGPNGTENYSGRVAGPNDGAVVERQLAEEGLSPQRLAAYRRDPLKAYEVDQAAQAAAATQGYKYYKDALAGQRADRAEAGRAEGRMAKKVAEALKPLMEGGDEASIRAANIFRSQITQAYEASGGSVPVETIIEQIMSSAPRLEDGSYDYAGLEARQQIMSQGHL